MASFRQMIHGVNAQIRKKGMQFSKTLPDRETAELWARYQEDLIMEMDAFNPPKSELITLGDAFRMKIEEVSKDSTPKTIADYKTTMNHMEEHLEKPLSAFTYDFFMDLLKNWEGSKVMRGGCKDKPNHKNMKPPSPHTILRRFAYTASVFQFMVEKGIDVDNNAQKVTTYVRQKIKELE